MSGMPTGRCCAKTKMSATTAGPCIRNSAASCQRSARRGRLIFDWERGIPYREGATHFDLSGESDAPQFSA